MSDRIKSYIPSPLLSCWLSFLIKHSLWIVSSTSMKAFSAVFSSSVNSTTMHATSSILTLLSSPPFLNYCNCFPPCCNENHRKGSIVVLIESCFRRLTTIDLFLWFSPQHGGELVDWYRITYLIDSCPSCFIKSFHCHMFCQTWLSQLQFVEETVTAHHRRDAYARDEQRIRPADLTVWESNSTLLHLIEGGHSTPGVLRSQLSRSLCSLWSAMDGKSSLDRKVDQILSSGDGIADRLSDIVNELVDSEAYGQLQTVLNRIVGDSVPQQVRGKLPSDWVITTSYFFKNLFSSTLLTSIRNIPTYRSVELLLFTSPTH